MPWVHPFSFCPIKPKAGKIFSGSLKTRIVKCDGVQLVPWVHPLRFCPIKSKVGKIFTGSLKTRIVKCDGVQLVQLGLNKPNFRQ